MKITALEEYGLRCLLQLAKQPEDALLTVSEIAAREGLSNEYVSKIMALLRKGELVESGRGVRGGYRLTKKPGEITLADISEAVSNPIYGEEFCNCHTGLEAECVHVDLCRIRSVWQDISSKINELMREMTLESLLEREEMESNKHV